MIIGTKQLMSGLVMIVTIPLLTYTFTSIASNLSLGLNQPPLRPISVLLLNY